jgi:predicted nucleic acid-binding protein
MIVIDASLAVEALLRTPLGVRAIPHVFHEERHAPHLIDIEFTHALRRMVLIAKLDESLAQLALHNMRAWDIERHSHTSLLPRVWQLRDSISAYDASYVALAEALEAPLLTCDSKLSRAHGHRAKIVLVA